MRTLDSRPSLWCAWIGALLCTCSSVLVAGGCASVPSRPSLGQLTPDELLAGAPLQLTQDRSAPLGGHDVLAMSPEMQAFVDEHTTTDAERKVRLRELVTAVIGGSRFELEYDETTRTAAETFRTRRGNCLSFSAMFLAMARHADLETHFQEVDTPPDWSLRDDTFVFNRHVNVLVELGRGSRKEKRTGSLVRKTVSEGVRIVDFNIGNYRGSYDRRLIEDARLLAHYHNNVAVERMQDGDVAAAFGHFRLALRDDAWFSPAWTNLGILYMRSGHAAHAEAAHLQALKADEADLVAMSNLASLYSRQGDRERAAEYRERVVNHRDKNPYYQFHLAREAFGTDDYDGAIAHLKKAIRTKKNEDRFYLLLGKSYLKTGDHQAARRWLAQARDVASTDAMRRRYASKMALLTGTESR